MRHRLPLILLGLAACTSSPGGSADPLVVSLHAGASQTTFTATAVPIRPAVLVTVRGAPAAGVTVTFRVTAGGGRLEGATQVTGSDGIARVDAWILGVAGPQAVEALVGDATGSPVIFTATAIQSVPAIVSIVRGNGTVGTVGLPVDETPRLRVVDGTGRPVAGIPVSWLITGGGGGFRYADNITDEHGEAGVLKWILGTTAGTNRVTATVDCGVPCDPITFTSSGRPGAVHQLQLASGDLQRVKPGEAVPVPPTVRLRDAWQNPTDGREVTFTVVQGGGTVTGAVVVSGADGTASVGSWVLGPGENILRAEAEGISVLFTAVGAP